MPIFAQNKALYDLHSQSVAQWTEIEALAKKQDDAALRTVLSALDTQYESMPRMVFCDNVIVNAVLAQRLCRMEQDSIRFAHQLRIPEQIGIQDIDLMCLFSNIMDNAIEACEELPENLQRWIRLQATLRSGLLLLTCENSAQPSAGNPLASSKQNTEAHGFGIPIIRDICRRYQSEPEIKVSPDRFYVGISLPVADGLPTTDRKGER